ncbi:MAG: NAD(P)H-hydrate epimerase [Pseudomonadota bacterium]
MSELLTSAQMRAIEQAAIASGTVTGLELMERAGARVVEAIAQEWPELGPGSGATVLCGPGNNGGDGFVVARLLLHAGWRVRVLAVPTVKRSPDASMVRARYRAIGGKARPFTHEYFRRGAPTQRRQPAERFGDYQDIFVDAVLGTGARGPMGGEVGEALAYMAGRHGDYVFFHPRTVAVDMPSGLDADSGEIPGLGRTPMSSAQHMIPSARLTVTFDSPKLGHVLGIGPEVCGKVVVADIGLEPWRTMGMPMRSLRSERTRLVIGPYREQGRAARLSDIWTVPDRRALMRKPSRYGGKYRGHKYAHGHALVLAGGFGRTGAARLAARAALRVGAGLVTVAAPGAAMMECATQLTAIMLRRCNDAEDLAALLEDKRFSSLCLGPGLGVGDRTRALVTAALQAKRPTVLDADALTSFDAAPQTLFDLLHREVTLTPHDGEFARLFPDLAAKMNGPVRPEPLAHASAPDWMQRMETSRKSVEAYRAALDAERAPLYSRVDAALDAAARAGCTVLLKGPATIIAQPAGHAAISLAAYDRAAPWLATAGSGDVLAGLITGLMATGRTFWAAESAAWLHVEAARSFGPGLIAEDLPEEIPKLFRSMGF